VLPTDSVVPEPAPTTDPFVGELPAAATQYQLKMVEGVMHVLNRRDESLAFGPIHGTMEFISDQNMLFALIADGPL
jgi:hypothetical protein